MPERLNAPTGALQNLQDAGCDDATVAEFLRLETQGCRTGQLCLLAQHRKSLLDAIHQNQRRLDCLDYLLFQLKKQATQHSKPEG